jgi:hypothetical protein
MPEPLRRPRTLAIEYDAAMRYLVPSNHDPNAKYLVELDAYGGNGMCVCKHFAVRCEPLLRRGVSPREAVATGAIKLKTNRHVEDALRCEHVLTARSQFLDEILEKVVEQRAAETRQESRYA